MADLRFEWDARKANANLRKHGVAFEEAQTAFFDDNALVMADPAHSTVEDRFVLLGATAASKLVVVCHCYRGSNDVIRLISARCANRQEIATYRERSAP
ncbi:MAG: BrnT family toxin [Deltaproteobacteria bacterium]|nr:BrnT family toxin [Deltaproteobacteria bacterium]